MNFHFFIKKTTFVFLLCFVISLSFVEANHSIRVKRTRSNVTPRHITSLARSGGGTYARRYSYGRPLPNYSMNLSRNKRNYIRNRRNGGRTYASKYRNWTPNRGFPGRNNPRVDSIRNGPPKKRKEPFGYVKEPHFGSPKQKRRIRPQRFNPNQRPYPPTRVNDYEEEYFVPDEAKRGENRFQRPKKKRRNPAEVEKLNRKPEVKFPYFEEKPFKKLKDTPVSYSTFIQHHYDSEEPDEFFEEREGEYSRPSIRNKKKRVKKKTNNSRKKNNSEDEYNSPYSYDKDEDVYSSPYLTSDDYEYPQKVKKPSKIKTFNDDEYPTKSILYSKQKPQVGPSLFSADSDSTYKGSSKVQETAHFNPAYSQQNKWSTLIQTTSRPLQSIQYQTESGFQPQNIPTQYNYQNKDYSSLQKTKTVTTNTQATYYSQPDNTYNNFAYSNNYATNQVSTTNNQNPTNYNYNAYSNSVYSNQPQQSYSQPLPSGLTYFSDVSVQKAVPIYDNTETFYNYNNNAQVNSQNSKYYDTTGQKYSTKVTFNSPEKKDSDEFIKKHQNLYNNGLSGIPVQGDGFAKDGIKKDYDIGYGDFQFDENPSS